MCKDMYLILSCLLFLNYQISFHKCLYQSFYIILNSLDKTQREEHIVWFDEIEDIIYKKPTRYKSGFISLYLSTRSFVTNKKKKYKLILNKIDEKILVERSGIEKNGSERQLYGIAKKRGYIKKNNLCDLERTAINILNEFRAGKLGKITLDAKTKLD